MHFFIKNHILIISILILLLAGCTKKPATFSGRNFKLPPIEVETYKVSSQNIKDILKTTGTLESPQTTEVTSELKGKIAYLNIPEGKLVNAGNVLAKIDSSLYEANLKVAEAKLKNAEENFNRMKALKDKGAISQQALDNAKEMIDTAKGSFDYAKSELDKSAIRAPFTGVLSFKKVSLGSYIDAGDAVVRISQINPLHLVFSFSEKYLSKLKVGQRVSFMVGESNQKYFASVIAIDPYLDLDTRKVNAKAIFQNLNKNLLPNIFANVELELGSLKNVLLIPQEAIINEGNKTRIATVSSENIVELKDIVIKEFSDSFCIAEDGLMPGDVVITSGHQKIKSGSKVIARSYNPVINEQLHRNFRGN